MENFIVLSLATPGGVQQADSLEAATALAEQLASDNPGQDYNVYTLVSRSYGEPPAKARVAVVTKDLDALKAEATSDQVAATAKAK